jgi:hypothetical protein
VCLGKYTRGEKRAGVAECKRPEKENTDACLKAALYRLAAMEEKSEEEPDGLSDPFGEGKVTWKYGKKLHQNEKKRDKDAESGDQAQVPGRFDEEEG